ncbi:MAG: efflux RND transporter periplasmic adaptor subunit [Clostridiales Family XIII bacterium]|jgi:HlyD family secretion protein|nr:efflux RND transporter periplasmic adaptor subunit [Clostridiales Family XIII bacterium]
MKKKKSKIKIVIILGCFIIAACAGAYYYSISGAISVVTEAAAYGRIEELIDETGTVTARQVSVVAAKNNYDIMQVLCAVGDEVNAGDLLIMTDTKGGDADVMSLRAQTVGLEAQLAQAERNAEQLKELYESGAVSKNDYDTAETAAKGIASQLQSLRHTIQSAQSNIQTNRVEAPVSGTVTELLVSVGDTVIMGTPLIEISDLNDMYINVSLIAGDAEKVTVGDEVRIEDSERAAKVEKISPKVAEVMSELGLSQKRVDVEVSVEDQTGLILGSDKELEIIIEEKPSVLIVPRKSVFSTNEKDYVYLVEEEKAALREVSVGIKGDDVYEILSGIEAGDLVIVSPDDMVGDGTRVKAPGV